MSDLHFTDEEQELVEAMARDRHGVASRLGFYASVLVPVFIFGAYGIARHDFLSLCAGEFRKNQNMLVCTKPFFKK
jgi:hypothetical protein